MNGATPGFLRCDVSGFKRSSGKFPLEVVKPHLLFGARGVMTLISYPP